MIKGTYIDHDGRFNSFAHNDCHHSEKADRLNPWTACCIVCSLENLMIYKSMVIEQGKDLPLEGNLYRRRW
jgi:hypothetical protein